MYGPNGLLADKEIMVAGKNGIGVGRPFLRFIFNCQDCFTRRSGDLLCRDVHLPDPVDPPGLV